MKKIVSSICIVFFALFLNAQITITDNQTASQLAQYLAGSGVTITNATLNCVDTANGIFNNAPIGLGISDGVVLSSGSVLEIPNSDTEMADVNNGDFFVPNGDADLDAILAATGVSFTTNDACVLEFDIDVIGDSLKFNYVFSSEEYTSFVCNGFNDIFAFFITGPNPSGGSYVNQNIALIPGTNTPVSINTVNDGTPNGFDPGCISTNTAYYNNAVTDIVFDGNTITLQAFALTEPCANYHFKIAIADGGDNALDSGVFIEQGSFSSTGVIVASSTILGAGFNTLVEGCVNGSIDFILDEGINTTLDPIVIHYSFGGTATHLVDFIQIPPVDSVIILPGDSIATVDIMTVADGVTEGIETIVINVITECGAVVASSIDIADVIPLTVNPSNISICNGDSATIILGGAQTYSWSSVPAFSNASGDSVLFAPSVSTSYTVHTELGTCVFDSIITVNVSNLSVNSTKLFETCLGNNDGSISLTTTDNIGTVTYNWDNGNTSSDLSNLGPNIYCVTVSDQWCTLNICDTIESLSTLTASIFKEDASCISNNDGSIYAVTSNGFGTVSYNWSDGNTDSLRNGLIPNNYCVTVADDFCTLPVICVDINFPSYNLELEAEAELVCKNDKTTLTFNGDLPSISSYSWGPQNLVIDPSASVSTETTPISQETVFYITGSFNGCNITDSLEIEIINFEVNPNYNDTVVAKGTTIDIGVNIVKQENVSGGINYDWTPTDYLLNSNAMNTTTTPDDKITYIIHSETNGCHDYDTITVIVTNEFKIPDAFTPNADGINDVFRPANFLGKIIEFRIYNRWGDLVHNSIEPWDGKYLNEFQPNDNYTYFIKINDGFNEKSYMNTLTLMK